MHYNVKLATPGEIQEMLDVITVRCTMCGGPARVPEDTLAVIDGKAAAVCPSCLPRFLELFREAIRSQDE